MALATSADRRALVLDVVLFIEAVLFVELSILPATISFRRRAPAFQLRQPAHDKSRVPSPASPKSLVAPNVLRIQRRDMHCDVGGTNAEKLRARHKVDSQFTSTSTPIFPPRDVASNEAFRRFAGCFFCSGRLPLLAQNSDRFSDVAAGFNQPRASLIRVCAVPHSFTSFAGFPWLYSVCSSFVIPEFANTNPETLSSFPESLFGCLQNGPLKSPGTGLLAALPEGCSYTLPSSRRHRGSTGGATPQL